MKGDSKQFWRYRHPLQCYVLLFQGNLVSQQVFLILFRIPFNLSGKNVSSRPSLEFINAHLQQRDEVASELRTVDFWLMLIVCGILVWLLWLLWLQSELFPRFFLCTFTTLPASYLVGTGMTSVREILY